MRLDQGVAQDSTTNDVEIFAERTADDRCGAKLSHDATFGERPQHSGQLML
jgi:hypothetical protein